MLSTTERRDQRGQTLVIVALGMLALMAFAALAFDAGQMMLDRRAQQDAADAAALAGARYLLDPANPTTSSPCNSMTTPTNCATAVSTALQTASTDHYGNGTSNGVAANGATVTVKIPPGPETAFADRAGFIEVQIQTNRPSIVGAILGFLSHPVGAFAVAGNYNGPTFNGSLLALNPILCQSARFGGSGTVTVGSGIQVDSSCNGSNPANSAFSQGGSSSVNVAIGGTINVVGSASYSQSHVSPPPTTGAPYMPDPFAGVPEPTDTTLPAAATLLGSPSTQPPSGCPGSANPASAAAPATCTFNTAGQTWVLSPGYYPGGIQVQKGTIYLLPGIYYIGGGGFNITATGSNSAAVFSVPADYTTTTMWTIANHSACDATSSYTPPVPSPCGGVMIYNSVDATNPSGAGKFAAINMTGNNATLGLYPIQQAPWTGLVIFQDRTQTLGTTGSGDISLNGNGSNLWVNGAIYAPDGYALINGTGAIGNSTQVVVGEFYITGSGTLNLPGPGSQVPQTNAAGLVQ